MNNDSIQKINQLYTRIKREKKKKIFKKANRFQLN